jgi:hypothetical protein
VAGSAADELAKKDGQVQRLIMTVTVLEAKLEAARGGAAPRPAAGGARPATWNGSGPGKAAGGETCALCGFATPGVAAHTLTQHTHTHTQQFASRLRLAVVPLWP